jgi:hypothetical protein
MAHATRRRVEAHALTAVAGPGATWRACPGHELGQRWLARRVRRYAKAWPAGQC